MLRRIESGDGSRLHHFGTKIITKDNTQVHNASAWFSKAKIEFRVIELHTLGTSASTKTGIKQVELLPQHGRAKLAMGDFMWRAVRSWRIKARRKRQKNRISMAAVEAEAARREHRAHSARARYRCTPIRRASSTKSFFETRQRRILNKRN